jgi:uncharacterized lipoprotein YmbA
MKLRLLSFLLVGVLTACASAPEPIKYYMLGPPLSPVDSVVELSNKPTLVIEEVELAAYLRQSGMIMQTGDNQLVVSRNHLWAESLELAVPKALVRELQQQSKDYSYFIKTLDWVGQTDFRLRLRIDSLQFTDQGEVVTAGRYQLISAADPASPVLVDFNFRHDIAQDGYAAAVAEINALLGQLAGAIIASVDKLASNEAEKAEKGSAEKGSESSARVIYSGT